MLYIFLIVGLIFIIWLLFYLKTKKAKFVLPYLILIFITPFYEVLDNLFFIKIFGCGCVPSTQKNMLNIPFNANNLRVTIYLILFLLIFGYSCKISANFKDKDSKLVYLISIIIVNFIIIYFINQIFMWA